MKAIIGVMLLAAVMAVTVWERRFIGNLSAENESLRAAKLEVDRLVNENRELPELRTAVGATVTAENASPSTELLRLRGEVSRLRAQARDPARLRAENERIAAEIASGAFTPKRLANMEGFVPREQWTNVGLATPEAAVQSYFAAMVSADFDLLFRGLTTENAEPMRQQLERDPGRFRQEFQKDAARLFGQATGFRIADRRQNSDDSVTLHIQFAADGVVTPMTVRRVANEWKISKLE
jgi:hypothetical protein